MTSIPTFYPLSEVNLKNNELITGQHLSHVVQTQNEEGD